MKIIRWILGIFLGLLVILVVGVVLLVNFINPNDFRDDINKTLSAKTQQPIAIQGDIKWIFFPELGFSIQDINIGNNQDTKNLSAAISHVDINLKLWPLLHKEVKINSLRLNGLTLNLPAEKADDGIKTPNASEAAIKASLAGFAVLPMLDLKDLDISHANINHRDTRGITDWEVKDFALHASGLGANKEIPISLSLTYQKLANKLSADIKLSTTLMLDPDHKQVNVTKTDLSVTTPSDSALPIKLKTNLEKIFVDLDKQKLVIAGLNGEFNHLNFSGQMQADNLTDHLVAHGKLHVQSAALKAFLACFGVHLPPTQSTQAFGSFDLTAPISYSDNQLTIDPFTMRLDSNIFSGSIKSNNLSSMAVQLNAQSNAIALADYLPAGPTPHKATISKLQINLSALPPLGENKNFLLSTLNTQVSIQQMSFDQFVARDLSANVEAKNGLLRFNQLHTAIWQGVVDATGSADLSGSQIKWTLNPNIQKIQVADLIHVIEPSVNFTGLANVKGTVSAIGVSPDVMKKSLNGNLNVVVNNGTLHGIDLNYWLGLGSAAIHHDEIPSLTDTKITNFGTFTSSVQITQGVVNTPDMLLKGNLIQMTGKGVADLNRQTLNYHLEIRKMNTDTGGVHADVVPVNVTGTFDDPKPSLDMAAITKAVFENQKDRVTKTLSQQISKKLGDSDLGNQLGQIASDSIGGLINSL